MTDNRTNNDSHRDIEVVCGSLIGVNIIATIEMLGMSALDQALTVALFCFAVSIPMLSLIVFFLVAEPKKPAIVNSSRFIVVLSLGLLVSLVGIAEIFFHFSTLVGGVFSGLAIAGIVMWLKT